MAGDRLNIVDANNEIVVSGCGCCGSPYMGDNFKGDAALIQVTPEMYELLKEMVRVFGTHSLSEYERARIVAARTIIRTLEECDA